MSSLLKKSECEAEMTPDHQCEKNSDALPMCHYCCHSNGNRQNPVHYLEQFFCADKVCSCQCYCTEESSVKTSWSTGSYSSPTASVVRWCQSSRRIGNRPNWLLRKDLANSQLGHVKVRIVQGHHEQILNVSATIV